MYLSAYRAPALQLDWLTDEEGRSLLPGPGAVALASCPGRPQSQVQLGVDLRELERQGVSVVLSLVEDEEMADYGVTGLVEGVLRHGMRHVRFPIIDRQPPEDMAATEALCVEVLRLLAAGDRVLIHCIGGWGRSGTIAAALLTHQGYSADEAIALVRAARHPFCVQTAAQEDFVRAYTERRRSHG